MKSLEYLDRYRNEGTRTYSKHSEYSEAKNEYRPTSKTTSFELASFRVPLEQLNIYRAQPPDELQDLYISKDHALFCVHPQVLDEFADDVYLKQLIENTEKGPDITVSPSSSTRTLYRYEPFFHAIKVHFPVRVSRYTRKMRDEVVEQAINISLEIEQGISHFDTRFGYLREVLGVTQREITKQTSRGENWGYLVRDMHPYPLVEEERTLVPGFSLYGNDFFDKEKTPLLFELIGKADPLEFVLENIMLPIVRHWVQCFKAFGYMLEPHGQNVLLELDDSKNITRIIHRDLSLGIDMRRRKDVGISSEHLNNYNRMEQSDFNSITYDMFMGNHFFDRIVECCREQFPNLTLEDFRAPCRQLFSEIFVDYKKYFPKTIRYFSEKRDRYNKPLYYDTGKSPQWRP